MRKQTSWLLIILLGVSFTYLAMVTGYSSTFPKLLAQVGITVGVAPNPYNTLNAQLNQEQDLLNQQAADLAAREAAFKTGSTTTNVVSPAIWYLIVAIVALALLVILNFYFDWRRSRQAKGV